MVSFATKGYHYELANLTTSWQSKRIVKGWKERGEDDYISLCLGGVKFVAILQKFGTEKFSLIYLKIQHLTSAVFSEMQTNNRNGI